VFVLLVVAFATNTTPTLVLKLFDDLFAGHELFIHTNTHHVKVKEKHENAKVRSTFYIKVWNADLTL
jgi:hypothetical protein